MSEEYKAKVIRALCPQELINIIMLNPTIYLKKDEHNTGIQTLRIETCPMGNCVFTRDQQITTLKGVVFCHFSATQRRLETQVLEFTLAKLGVRGIGHIADCHDRANLEGGDFVILDAETAAMGVGLRSSYSAGLYLM